MNKKDFAELLPLIPDFNGGCWEELFMPSRWKWRQARFKWVGMMSFQIFEIEILGLKIRQEAASRSYTYWKGNKEYKPFTTRVYYAHPNGSLKVHFDDAVKDLITRMSDEQKKAVQSSKLIYAL